MHIRSVREKYFPTSRRSAYAIVFLPKEIENRPFGNGEKDNIIKDFAWRRTVSFRPWEKDTRIIELVAGYLKVKPEDIILKFDRKAGCTTCPCSPGLLARIRNCKRDSWRPLPAIFLGIGG